jgi:DNA-binding NarL/FixJ family response regulator
MKEKISVIIADDHDIYRDGLQMLLNSDEIEVVGEASNGRQLLLEARKYKPDVILTDLIMPGGSGIEAIKELVKEKFERIIAISFFDSDSLIVEALESGAIGYLHKNVQKTEIIEAIKDVNNFRPYYCKATDRKLARLIFKSQFNPYSNKTMPFFSQQDIEIIGHVCQEKSSEEIGKILCMSPRTVEGHRSRIAGKMNVRTPIGFVIYAIKNHLYIIDPTQPPPLFN